MMPAQRRPSTRKAAGRGGRSGEVTDDQVEIIVDALAAPGEVVCAGRAAPRTGRWEARCGCVHWFESGYATPSDCPDCHAPVVRWDWVSDLQDGRVDRGARAGEEGGGGAVGEEEASMKRRAEASNTLDIPINYIARPILGAWERSGVFHVPTVYGTGFPIGGALHFTAHHVVASIEEAGKTLIVGSYPMSPTEGGTVALHAAVVVGRWPKLDLAAVAVLGLTTRAIQWRAEPLSLLTPVRSVDYPFGLEIDQYTQQIIMYVRAFAGHVISSCRAKNLRYLPGDPLIYELSFTAHLGLSGAALLTANNEIVGCVVRNRTTLSADGDEMSLGLAVQSSELLALRIDDGSSIGDLVLKCGGRIQ
jgi:Trypsin-like peptidase domain